MTRIRPSLAGGTAALVAALALGVGAATAQDYPSDRITVVVGFSAGGFADSVARIVGDHVSQTLGQPVTVENQPGAASNIAARAVADAEPDGYTVLVTTTAMAVNQTMYQSLEYSIDDLVPVAVPVSAPETFGVHPNHPATTLEEFIDWAEGREFNFASAGVGSGSHLATEFFFRTRAELDATHVPFGGGAPAVQALLGEQVDAIAATLPGISSQYMDDALRCLAVAGSERAGIVPDCPTFAEAGFPDFEAASWVGFFVPAGTDQAIIETLNEAINAALDDDSVRERLVNLGNTIAQRDVADTASFVDAEVARWGEMVTTVGVSVE